MVDPRCDEKLGPALSGAISAVVLPASYEYLLAPSSRRAESDWPALARPDRSDDQAERAVQRNAPAAISNRKCGLADRKISDTHPVNFQGRSLRFCAIGLSRTRFRAKPQRMPLTICHGHSGYYGDAVVRGISAQYCDVTNSCAPSP